MAIGWATDVDRFVDGGCAVPLRPRVRQQVDRLGRRRWECVIRVTLVRLGIVRYRSRGCRRGFNVFWGDCDTWARDGAAVSVGVESHTHKAKKKTR